MRLSLSSLAVTGISISQVAQAWPLLPQRPFFFPYGLREHPGMDSGDCETLEKGHGPTVRPDNVWAFQAYKPFTVHDTFPTFLSPSLTDPGISQDCKDARGLQPRRNEYASSHRRS